MINVCVFGVLGRMGQEIMTAVNSDRELTLVSAMDSMAKEGSQSRIQMPAIDGNDPNTGFNFVPSLDELQSDSIDVIVDFTNVDAIEDHMRFCAERSINLVLGTSGVTEQNIKLANKLFDGEDQPNVVIASNFAIGAVMMMHFAKIAAPFFDSAEIIEYHHDQKVDAPSGTAITTAEIMDQSRRSKHLDSFSGDRTKKLVLDNPRGAVGKGNIPIHSVRLNGVVANQEVIFGTTGQTLIIKHDTVHRSAFMPGVLLAIKNVPKTPGVTLGIEKFLGIE